MIQNVKQLTELPLISFLLIKLFCQDYILLHISLNVLFNLPPYKKI